MIWLIASVTAVVLGLVGIVAVEIDYRADRRANAELRRWKDIERRTRR
jgi:hypothetical protein